MAKKNAMTKAGKNLPAVVDFGEDVGVGYEGVDASHLKIPFINLLQDLSPVVKKGQPEFIEGAEVGMLMNSVTKELYPDGIEFVPSHVEHVFVEWVPRKRGGGFAGVHNIGSSVVSEARANADGFNLRVQRTDEDGNTVFNDLVETFYVSGVAVLDDGARLEPIILAATSTKITPYKNWMTRVNMFTVQGANGRKQRPPLFAHRVRISSFDDKNAKGIYKNISIAPAVNNSLGESLITDVTSELFQSAKEVRNLITSGSAVAAYDSQQEVASVPEDDTGDNF